MTTHADHKVDSSAASHEPHQQQGKHAHHDHADHHRMMIRDFRKRFYVALLLTLPVLAMSELIQGLLGFSFSFAGSNYVVFALASFIFFYGGWPFLTGMASEIREKNPGMMTLIAVAITVAYVYSAAVTFGLRGTPFYWELATLIAIMLAGHWIEMASVLSASSALEKLAQLMPSTAHRKDGSEINDIALDQVRKGDILLIKPGEKIPSDGMVAGGGSYVDESMLTGESKPVEKAPGDQLIGGSINGDGSLELEVVGAGEDSYLSKVIEMVREAQATKSRTQALSDRAAFWLTIVAISVGFGTLVVWLLVGRDLQFAIARMATVMIITCPHALGLAIPLVVSVSTSKAAQNGLLIRNRTAFENARKITTVVFDKTGTLTEGSFAVTSIDVHAEGHDSNSVLSLAAALEQNSEHPIGKGIVRRAQKDGIEIPATEEFLALKGKGVTGKIAGKQVQVVSPGYLTENGLERPEGATPRGGVTRVFVIVDGVVAGSVAMSDSIRPESYAAIEELQAAGEYVAMTGDGVNDSPALAQAQIGIAVGSGTDIAAATADIILVNSNPRDITALILFGQATYRKMVQNLIWATGYNVVAIPLAAGVLYGAGVVLSPEIGAILMSASTVIVAINARLLRVRKSDREVVGSAASAAAL